MKMKAETHNTARSTAAQERAFAFLRLNERPPKPRTRGITEIRGPYYTPMGPRYLQDILETIGGCVDALKFAGSFALMPKERVMFEAADSEVFAALRHLGDKKSWGRVLTYKG